MVLTVSGTILMFFGLVVSIIFWIPGIFDRGKVKDIMGKRYPIVYVVYVANGPLLTLLGLLLIAWPKFQ